MTLSPNALLPGQAAPAEIRRMNEKDSDANEQKYRKKFRDRDRRDCARAFAHTADVDEHENAINRKRSQRCASAGPPRNGTTGRLNLREHSPRRRPRQSAVRK